MSHKESSFFFKKNMEVERKLFWKGTRVNDERRVTVIKI